MRNSTVAYLRTARRASRHRNRLVRTTDRIEARLTTALVLFVVAMIPMTVWAGARVWDTQLELSAQQLAERTLVTATTDGTPELPVVVYSEFAIPGPLEVPASWTWGHETRHGTITVDTSLPSGSRTQIWVDAVGEPALPPMNAANAKVSAVVAGASGWVASVLLAGAVFALARWRLDRARTRRWSRDIETFLGSTSSY